MKHVLELSLMAAMVAGGVTAARAQEQQSPAPSAAEPTDPRLRVRFVESRERDGKTTAAPPCVLLLHPGPKGASVFVGTQVPLRASDKTTPTVVFKNAGLQVEVTAHVEPDGRFRLDASVEESWILGDGGAGASNPVLQTVKSASQVLLRDGESAPFASALDPVTGERVTVDVSVDALPAAKRPPAARPGGRVRAHFVMRRRHEGKTVVSRPYSITLLPGQEKPAYVFGGATLPLEMSYQGQPTVMLKDVGAGLRLAVRRLEDGRYRLGLSVTDGALAPAGASPRIQALQVESTLDLQGGETVVVASAPDRVTGDVVEAEVTLEVTP